MLKPDLSRYRLPIPVAALLHLEESMADVQVALPGFPSQNAAAWVVALRGPIGGEVILALQLRDSGRQVIYPVAAGLADKAALNGALEEARQFVDSLGFLLAAVELQQMPEDERQEFWHNAPLFTGRVSLPLELRSDRLAAGRLSLKKRLGRLLVSC